MPLPTLTGTMPPPKKRPLQTSSLQGPFSQKRLGIRCAFSCRAAPPRLGAGKLWVVFLPRLPPSACGPTPPGPGPFRLPVSASALLPARTRLPFVSWRPGPHLVPRAIPVSLLGDTALLCSNGCNDSRTRQTLLPAARSGFVQRLPPKRDDSAPSASRSGR